MKVYSKGRIESWRAVEQWETTFVKTDDDEQNFHIRLWSYVILIS